jgi:hypothetical protein
MARTSRRTQPRRPRRTSAEPRLPIPTHQYTLRGDIPDRYLSDATILQGITREAQKLNLTLHPDDVQWLLSEQHSSCFQMFLNPQSQEGINKYQCNEQDLETTTQSLLASHKVYQNSPRFGTMVNTANYETTMENQLSYLWKFLAMRGKYDSMLLLLPHPPLHSPAMDLKEIAAYVLFKYLPVGELKHPTFLNGNQCLTDICGENISSIGSCSNYQSFDVFFAAIRQIHKCNGHGGDFSDICLQCLALYTSQQELFALAEQPQPHLSMKCPHCTRPSYYRMGDPCSDVNQHNLRKWLHKESSNRGYTVTPTDSLLPSDLFDIHAQVHSGGYSDIDLEFYTLTLLGIYVYARFDTFHDVEYNDLDSPEVRKLFNSSSTLLECLAIKVKGKNDPNWLYYQIFFNDEQPKVCFLRHLLVWLHVSGIDTGSIFPDIRDLENPHLREHSKMDHAKYVSWLASVVRNCRNSHDLKIGTHTLRRTAYLLAVLGGASFQDVMRNARHRDEESAKKYYTDAQQTLQRLRDNILLSQQQPTWKFRDTLTHRSGENQNRLNQFISNRVDMDLATVSKFFVEKMLGVSPTHSKYKDAQFLLQTSYAMDFSSNDPFNECQAILQTLSPPIRASLETCLRRVASRQVTTTPQVTAPPLHCEGCNCHPAPQPVRDQLPMPNTPIGTSFVPVATPIQPSQMNPLHSPRFTNFIPGTQHPVHHHTLPATIPWGRHVLPVANCQLTTQQPMLITQPSSQPPHQPPTPFKYISRCSKHRDKFDISTFLRGKTGLKMMKPRDRVFALSDLVNDIEQLGSIFPNIHPSPYDDGKMKICPDRKYIFTRYLDQFHRCLSSCHASDPESFLQSHPSFQHSIYLHSKNGEQCSCHQLSSPPSPRT